ncbi:MAG: folate-binding protein YgfZ [Arenimonas sp.]|nr:folate-binding protein YgfZ [Arenimonas sp.]
MSFKTNRQPGSSPVLSGFSLLGFSGPEAGAFLQAQTMNDVHALALRQWHWNGWLNPKGRVIALFALLRLADGEYLAVLPDFPAGELLPMLQRFVFRAKVRLQVITDLVACAEFEPLAGGDFTRDQAQGTRESGVRLDFGGCNTHRHLLLLPESCAPVGQPDPAFDGAWMSLDLAHGLPRLIESQRESWTPQMLSLERLHAFSLKKGCYPGQEIVARTHYLGQARRGLCRVLGSGLEIGAILRDGQSNPVGSIICTTPDAESALAVLQLDRKEATVAIDGQAVALPDFQEGLARPL